MLYFIMAYDYFHFLENSSILSFYVHSNIKILESKIFIEFNKKNFPLKIIENSKNASLAIQPPLQILMSDN